MQKKYAYSILGIFVGAFVNILFNLIAAAIQQRAIGEKFNNQTIWWIGVFSVVGLLVGYWLSLKVESSDSSVSRSGIKARGINSREGRFIANEKTGQGIDAENINAKSDIELTSSDSRDYFSQSFSRESASGSIDARALTAGGNIAIFNGSIPLADQLEYFRNELNLPSNRPNDYTSAKFQSYWEVWKILQLLCIAGEHLWEKVNPDNLLAFSAHLRVAQSKVEEGAIFFDEDDYVNLKSLLRDFGDFRLGKINLLELRSDADLMLVSGGMAQRQIELNRGCKERYERLLDKIRISFRDRIRT